MGGQERERIECLPDDLRAFGINADHWRPAAQDEGEWRRTAEQGAEYFIAKWIAAEKAKQRMVSLCAGSLAISDKPQFKNLYSPGSFGSADAVGLSLA